MFIFSILLFFLFCIRMRVYNSHLSHNFSFFFYIFGYFALVFAHSLKYGARDTNWNIFINGEWRMMKAVILIIHIKIVKKKIIMQLVEYLSKRGLVFGIPFSTFVQSNCMLAVALHPISNSLSFYKWINI